MRRSRYHLSEPEPHGNGWMSQSERMGASRWYYAYQEDPEGYAVPGTSQRFDYARDALAYIESRKHEPQPAAPPPELLEVRERIRQVLDRLP